MNPLVKSLSIAICSLLSVNLLSSCATTETERTARDADASAQQIARSVRSELPRGPNIRGSQQHSDQLSVEQKNGDLLRRSSSTWVGSGMIPVNSDDRLPDLFRQMYVMNFGGTSSGVPLAQVAARLTELSGLPVRISPDVFEIASSDSADVQALPLVGAEPGAAPGQRQSVSLVRPQSLYSVQMKWNGTLTGFLNDLTSRLGLSWEYQDNAILIMRYVTQVYELASFPNGVKYAMDAGATGARVSEGSNASSSIRISEAGELNGLKSMVSILEKMLSVVPGSSVSVADGTGRLIVRTSKDMQSQVREFIRQENANLLKQVHVQIDLYSVLSGKDEQLGFNWDALYRSLSGNLNIDLSSPASLVGDDAGIVRFSVPSLGSDSNRRFANSAAIVQALSQLGSNVQYRPISLIAMNRQWARKARLTTTGYLSETKPAAAGVLGGASGIPGLTTDSITTGDQFAIMPYVLENNTVLLKMGISLSDLLGLFEVTTGTGATLQRVQTPNTSSISDQYTISLQPGEVMAVTGLSREVKAADTRRLSQGAPLIAGGSNSFSLMEEHFLVFIRAVIL